MKMSILIIALAAIGTTAMAQNQEKALVTKGTKLNVSEKSIPAPAPATRATSTSMQVAQPTQKIQTETIAPEQPIQKVKPTAVDAKMIIMPATAPEPKSEKGKRPGATKTK